MNKRIATRTIQTILHLVLSKDAPRTVCGWPTSLVPNRTVDATKPRSAAVGYCQDCVLLEHGMEILPR